MTASTVWINGARLGEYKGGYTPFFFDLTPHINFGGENAPPLPPFRASFRRFTVRG